MKKIIMALFLAANLHAINYEELLKIAIQNNTELRISESQKQQVLLENQIETRLKNPSLELEVANFSSNRPFLKDKLGSTIGISQSILLPSIKTAKSNLGKTKSLIAEESYKLKKVSFIYKMNMHYLAYKKAVKVHQVKTNMLKVSKKIMNIAKKRYEQGTALKSDYLQAKIAYNNLRNSEKEFILEIQKTLNALKVLANIEEKIILSEEHYFNINSMSTLNPELSLIQKKKELSKAKEEIASHSIKSFEVYTELENEPDEDIFRIGINIELPVFNQNTQERQLAKIEWANQSMKLTNQTKAFSIAIKQLEEENILLQKMLGAYEALTEEQNRLLNIYQKGYGIAKVNLLTLETSKKLFMSNQENIIITKLEIERNIIKRNYLKGGSYE